MSVRCNECKVFAECCAKRYGVQECQDNAARFDAAGPFEVWGSWEGEVDEPICTRESYTDAMLIANRSTRGLYPWGEGSPTRFAFVMPADTGAGALYSTRA